MVHADLIAPWQECREAVVRGVHDEPVVFELEIAGAEGLLRLLAGQNLVLTPVSISLVSALPHREFLPWG